MKEADRIREILAAQPHNQRLFRINSGMGWAGKMINRKQNIVILEKARPLHAAPEGWPDLCGWTEVEITPDMVGKRIAVFTAVEVKVTGKLSKAQARFRDIVVKMGGIFTVEK